MFAIRIYWRIPTKLHSKCIFRETCSHYVYRIAEQKGFIEGIKALRERNGLCRPGYLVYRFQGHFYLKTAGGQIFEEGEISHNILPPQSNQFMDFDNMSIDKINNSLKLKL